MVRFGRVDGNQSDLVTLTRQIPGVSVKILSDVGDGFTDTIIGRMGVNYLVEIKLDEKSRLTPAQMDFHGMTENTHLEWKGQKAIARTFDDILNILGLS